jgi:hyperosmotically inducible periplasmic protein
MKRIIGYLSIFSLLIFIAAGCNKSKTTSNEDVNKGYGTKTTEPRTDTGITTEVKAKITDDDLLNNTDISVETNDGMVTLKGTVENDAQVQRAKEIATNVDGVKMVHNDLKIGTTESTANKAVDETKNLANKTEEGIKDTGKKAGKAINDASITAEIKLKLAGDDLTDALDINVDTQNAVVTLNGTVGSQAEADRAVQLARSVEDVKNVHSKLKIQANR